MEHPKSENTHLEVANKPKMDVATVPNKELAVVPNKEVVQVGCKAVAVSLPPVVSDVKLNQLPKHLRDYIEDKAKICQPDSIHICDGSEAENQKLLKYLQEAGTITKLEKMKNW